jgi:hypothetical protein
MIKIKILFSFLFIIAVPGLIRNKAFAQNFDKVAFYKVMKSGGVGEINTQLSNINDVLMDEKDAYVGALLMKKAGLIQKPKDKLFYFKSGRIKLETAIRADSNNIEYHFLRLTIQEHVPAIVHYSDQLEADSHYVQKFFKKLVPTVQHAVLEYAKTSKVLHVEDIKQ